MLAQSVDDNFIEREILDPDACKKIHPTLSENVWVYRYTHTQNSWILSIGTHLGASGKLGAKLSLGGFRIVPEARAKTPGFNPDHEAIELAVGMEEKVYWSRTIGVGGPLGIKNVKRIVGGKCVLLPSADARIGKKRDFELLDFAIRCLNDFEAHSGVHAVTGQDLGHGIMSDGKTTSLGYLRAHFRSGVLEDTSKPTGEGNFYMLRGMLAALGINLSDAKIGLIGLGNIGEHLMQRLLAEGATVYAIEMAEDRRARAEKAGVKTFIPDNKSEFLALDMHAVVVNANASSLDIPAVESICKNPQIKVVCGCENLAMPDPVGEKLLIAASKIYCHTELCGMMGYLTAVEEFLSRTNQVSYSVGNMFEAAKKLEEVGFKASTQVIESKFKKSFGEAVKSIYSNPNN